MLWLTTRNSMLSLSCYHCHFNDVTCTQSSPQLGVQRIVGTVVALKVTDFTLTMMDVGAVAAHRSRTTVARRTNIFDQPAAVLQGQFDLNMKILQ